MNLVSKSYNNCKYIWNQYFNVYNSEQYVSIHKDHLSELRVTRFNEYIIGRRHSIFRSNPPWMQCDDAEEVCVCACKRSMWFI